MVSRLRLPFEDVLINPELWSNLESDISLTSLAVAIEEVGANNNASINESDCAQNGTQTEKNKNSTAGKDEPVVIPVASAEGTTSPRPFIEFPAEIHLKIFDLLCPVNSTCFGLTCKKFYQIHRSYHGTVPLLLRSSSLGANQDGRRLGSRIRGFFDRKLHFNKKELGKYVTQKRAQELRDERWKNRDMSVDTNRMSYMQRNRYLAGFQSDDSDWDEDE
ncbi:uncharacterized protein PAC_09659 [Phialocephala subalpina]|uniref:F-box domain-containing protein n=1 Tax=Phialocephala subalpina TaxID=576137 RepID=A0A1L7X417_9HELO|nr:uncharacterized protein PAC_09659 [Phialocephala subalpina]